MTQLDITPFTAVSYQFLQELGLGTPRTGPTIYTSGLNAVPISFPFGTVSGHATPSTPPIPSEGVLWPL